MAALVAALALAGVCWVLPLLASFWLYRARPSLVAEPPSEDGAELPADWWAELEPISWETPR